MKSKRRNNCGFGLEEEEGIWNALLNVDLQKLVLRQI